MGNFRSKRRRKRGETADRVLDAFDKNRAFTSVQLGNLLGLHPAYVRKALTRNGRRLRNSSR